MSINPGTDRPWVYEGYAAEPALRDLDHSRFVPGDGSKLLEDPRVIVVGEAPGRTEAEVGRPFCGRSGMLLRELMEEAGLDPAGCWITNVVKYRPVGPGGKDRTPTDVEIAASLPYLWRELELVSGSCRILCAVGRVAAEALSGREVLVGRDRGTWRIITDPAGVRYALYITYHPAAALRSTAFRKLLAADIAALTLQVNQWGPLASVRLV